MSLEEHVIFKLQRPTLNAFLEQPENSVVSLFQPKVGIVRTVLSFLVLKMYFALLIVSSSLTYSCGIYSMVGHEIDEIDATVVLL
jgi:hypothetical protein